MATNRTDSKIKSTAAGGRDYSTIQAWEDDIGVGLGTSTNLVTDDYDHYGWLYSEEFDENVTISGHTTDSSHKIYLAADSNGATVTASQHSHTKGDSALMDDDTRALAYNTSYASILGDESYDEALNISTANVDISRIQVYASSTRSYAIKGNSTTNVSRCLVQDGRTTGTYDSIILGNFYASLLVIVGSVFSYTRAGSGANIINSTFVRSSGASLSATGQQINVEYGRPTFENCAFFGGGAGSEYIGANGGTSWSTLDYNATDFTDISSKTGEGSNNTYSLTQSDQFTAVNNTDWSLKTGNDLDTGGVDRTSTVPKDIWGNDFNAGDIGCEASAAVGAYTLTVTQGTATVTGQSVGMLRGVQLDVTEQALTVTGQSVGMNRGLTLGVTEQALTVAGQSADMLRGVQLDATEQALTVSGQLVTMTYTPVGSYDLIVTEGVATVSGQSVDLLRGLQLDATEQALTVTGQSVDMTYAPSGSYNLAVTAGTATVTGQLVDLLYSRVLTVTEQAVTVTGQLADMTYAQPGAYTLEVTQGTATVTGQSVTMTYSAALDLATVYARLTEVWQILGLDPNSPMTVTPTSRVSGDISQTISGDGITSTTVTRDP